MSVLTLIGNADDDDDLRLPSRVFPTGAAGRRLHRREAHELAIERVRRNIQMARVNHVAEVAHTGIIAASLVTRAANSEAASFPEDRGRVDAMADMAAARILSIIGELGQ